MSVKIRLRRIGRKKQPYYRLVVIDSKAPRDGAYLDAVGFYNPGRKPAELRVDMEKVDTWASRGAQMTDTVASLLRKARKGGDATVEVVPVGGAAPEQAAPEQPAAAAATPAPAPPAAPAAAASEPAPAPVAEPAEPEAESPAAEEPEEQPGA